MVEMKLGTIEDTPPSPVFIKSVVIKWYGGD